MLSFLNFRRSEKAPDAEMTSKRLAGPGFIILNVMRAMNITGLLAAIAASLIMVIKTFTASKFFFFDGATHIITALSSMFLVVSECSLFRKWYIRNWPVLTDSHGFNFLGLAMIIIGNNLLGNLNKSATSQESLGMPFWRIVIGSGIIVFALGFLNIIASLVFCDRKLKVTARMIRSKGAVAITDRESQLECASTIGSGKPGLGSIVTSFPNSSYAASSKYSQASPVKNKSPVRRFMHNARQSLLPSYRSEVPPYPRSPPGGYPQSPPAAKKNETSEAASPPMEISAPLNVNPQFAHLVRPDMAHHPSQRRPDNSF